MGEVYKARDIRLERTVALKVLPADLFEDKERAARFEREAKLLASLNHPGIAAIYSFEEIPGSPGSPGSSGRHVLVMEFLEGQTLRERLRAGPPSTRRAAEIAAQIARGLAAAHEKGIVHRDLKPENVFLTKDDRVKILDFGLAKLTRRGESVSTASQTESLLTEAGVVFGTVGYMSPEQVRGEMADHRSDFFSFGTILYEMLSGKNPFRAATAAETMTAILREEPSFSYPAFGAAPGLSLIVARCLEKTPGKRFHSSEDLAFALEALSQPSPSLPGLAARPGTASRLSMQVLLGALGLVVLAGALAVTRLWNKGSPQLKFTQITFGMSGLGGRRLRTTDRRSSSARSAVHATSRKRRSESSSRPGSAIRSRSRSGSGAQRIESISASGEMLITLVGRARSARERSREFRWGAAFPGKCWRMSVRPPGRQTAWGSRPFTG